MSATTAVRTWLPRSRIDLLREIGGGFGDVGLLAPLAVGLITLNHLNATAVLAGAGIFYLATAFIYRLPVPVQPLKAVSAIAIASGLGPPGIAAAGLEIGAIFLLLSVTGVADLLRRVFVPPIVRGIQLGIGLLLAKAALDLIFRKHQLAISVSWLSGGGAILVVLIGFTVLLALLLFERRAIAGGSLLLLAAGLLLGVAVGIHPHVSLGIGPQPLSMIIPSATDFANAFWLLALPQVGLSLGNSLMATSSAARSYFGAAGERVTPGRLGLSIGLANLVISPLSGMPMCHGAGGMTAHYRMGARGWFGIAFYGSVLLLLGLAFGASAAAILALIPAAVLGGFLLYVGVEHAALMADLRGHWDFLVAGLIAAVAAATGNITAGVVCGFIAYGLVRLTRSEQPASL